MADIVSYRQEARKLLNDMSFAQVVEADLVGWINAGRLQLALEGEATRLTVNATLLANTRTLNFTDFAVPANQGYSQPLVIRAMFNPSLMEGRAWDWFTSLYFGNPASGPPTVWAQQKQGSSGSLRFYPVPTVDTPLQADVVMGVIPLQTTADVEAIPDPWTEAVPYYAAFKGYLQMQQMDQAMNMFKAFELFARRARELVTSSNLPGNFQGRVGTEAASLGTTLAQPPRSQGQAQQGASGP